MDFSTCVLIFFLGFWLGGIFLLSAMHYDDPEREPLEPVEYLWMMVWPIWAILALLGINDNDDDVPGVFA